MSRPAPQVAPRLGDRAPQRFVRFAGLTDRGRKRVRNEDAVLVAPEHGLIAVADGMGGHKNGDVASRTAIDALDTFFRRTVGWEDASRDDDEVSSCTHWLTSAFRIANWRLYYGAAPDPLTGIGMGSTLVAARFGDGGHTMTLAHVGDSRGYRMRKGALEKLTEDHSLRAIQKRLGKPWERPPPNVLTRALGIDAELEVDVLHAPAEVGDLVLLCSDGFWGRCSDEEIAFVLSSTTSLDAACGSLVALANEHGGTDNITVALASVHEMPTPRSSEITSTKR